MYEITYISKNEQEPVVKNLLKEMQAKIISEEDLGRKRFTYPIGKEQAGFYTTIIFEIDNNKLAKFSQKLKMEDGILRYLIVKKIDVSKTIETPKKEVVSEKVITETELPAVEIPKKAKAEKTAKVIEKKPKKKTSVVKVPKIEKVAPQKEEKEVTVTEEDRLKKLDEKLDELLKE